MAPSDPAFFSCYEPVGDFPGVALSFKLIYTRLITAFGSAGSGILCLEPVIHVPDAPNRPDFAGYGPLTMLSPGESLTASLLLRAEF